ncbi:MAG TPA: 30S ribosomal protein S21 [Sedimentisphaerales bacterium]|nr:30S ribosomal protein S21 [Sedimentisphaerales bacterium]
MLKIKARAGESVQQMVRRFKKLCEKEGLIRDMKRNAYYEKPSEQNRRRIRKAQRAASFNNNNSSSTSSMSTNSNTNSNSNR